MTNTTNPRSAYDFLCEVRDGSQRKIAWHAGRARFDSTEQRLLARAQIEQAEITAAALSICPTIAQVRSDFEDDAAARTRISEIASANHPYIEGVTFAPDGQPSIAISPDADGIGSFEISDLVEEITRITLDVAGYAPAKANVTTSGAYWVFDTEFETLNGRPATEVLDEYLGD